jgi:hypothetical protein
MILKLLEKIGRKKAVLDRGPSHPKYSEAKPWMNRYYLLFRNRPKWFPFNILIHEMIDDDHGEGVHNHMCPSITIILRGGYWETLTDGKYWRRPGFIGFRSADNFHRVDLKKGSRPLTLYIPGPFGLRKGPRANYNLDFKTKYK